MPTMGHILRTGNVFAVQKDQTVFDAVRLMTKENIGAIAVLEGTRLVGIFSERDVVSRVISREMDPRATSVESVMTRDLVVADVSESQESCLRKMKAANCRHLPVVSGESLVGIISLRDLLQVELTEKDEKLEYLTSYLFHIPPGTAPQ